MVLIRLQAISSNGGFLSKGVLDQDMSAFVTEPAAFHARRGITSFVRPNDSIPTPFEATEDIERQSHRGVDGNASSRSSETAIEMTDAIH